MQKLTAQAKTGGTQEGSSWLSRGVGDFSSPKKIGGPEWRKLLTEKVGTL